MTDVVPPRPELAASGRKGPGSHPIPIRTMGSLRLFPSSLGGTDGFKCVQKVATNRKSVQYHHHERATTVERIVYDDWDRMSTKACGIRDRIRRQPLDDNTILQNNLSERVRAIISTALVTPQTLTKQINDGAQFLMKFGLTRRTRRIQNSVYDICQETMNQLECVKCSVNTELDIDKPPIVKSVNSRINNEFENSLSSDV